MPPVNILIKPASSACNMACAYCFYRDVASNRGTAFEGMLSLETMATVIRSAFEYADHLCSFTFQGGEPTLRGLDFFREVVKLQKACNTRGLRVVNSIQTNGLAIDEEWAAFLAENQFLVGLSLDGPSDLHNLNRIDTAGKGTFSRVLHAAQLFDRYHVEYNVLCVVTGRNARSIEKIYRFYKRQGFRYLQFIPCLEPLGQERGQEAYHLSTAEYGQFLIRLFDLWLDDFRKGEYISIRHLDNWLFMLLGQPPEACNMAGQCSIQFVVEGDGGVYPCDFYVLDEWRMGTIGQTPLADMASGPVAQRFIAQSLPRPDACQSCPYVSLCRNGCRRDRAVLPDGTSGLNQYCEAYQTFFSQRGRQLGEALALVRRWRAQNGL